MRTADYEHSFRWQRLTDYERPPDPYTRVRLYGAQRRLAELAEGMRNLARLVEDLAVEIDDEVAAAEKKAATARKLRELLTDLKDADI